MRRSVAIVTYHDIADDRGPLTSQLYLSTRPDVFRGHVTYFKRNFDFISANDLIAGKLPRKALLLTFDDAYRSVLTVAGPILKEVNAPSLFFVIPSVVQDKLLPIDNVLSLAVEELGPLRVLDLLNAKNVESMSVGEMMSRYVANMRQHEIAAVKTRIFSALGVTEDSVRGAAKEFMNGAEMRRLLDYGIKVGNHSMTHSYFRSLSKPEIEFEIGQSRQQLQDLSGQTVRCLSVPYGDLLDATPDVMAFARSCGHAAIFLVHARSNRFRPSEDTYYRTSLRNEGIRRLGVEIRLLSIARSIYNGFPFMNATA